MKTKIQEVYEIKNSKGEVVAYTKSMWEAKEFIAHRKITDNHIITLKRGKKSIIIPL